MTALVPVPVVYDALLDLARACPLHASQLSGSNVLLNCADVAGCHRICWSLRSRKLSELIVPQILRLTPTRRQ